MSESIKSTVENLLGEKRKSKRDLSKALNISENSVNRTLNNPKISLLKLQKAADFLEVDVIDLLPKKDKNSLLEPTEKFRHTDPADATDQLTINNLSDALNRSAKTIEQLVKIIADYYSVKNQISD